MSERCEFKFETGEQCQLRSGHKMTGVGHYWAQEVVPEPTYTAADLAKARADERLVVIEAVDKVFHTACQDGFVCPLRGLRDKVRELSTPDTEAARQAIVADAVAKATVQLSQMVHYAKENRCMACGWPLGEVGCKPNDCSFRPDEHSIEYPGWRARTEILHPRRAVSPPLGEGERASASPGEQA